MDLGDAADFRSIKFTDFFTLSYQATFFNSDFVSLFSDTDVRNTFLGGALGGTPSSYFYYISTKFTFTFDADHPVMRTPEFMLVEAEAKARQDRTGNSRLIRNLTPDDNRFFLKIPQVEIDANDNIDDSVNNGR